MSARSEPLAEYRARRDFARTPEPAGAMAAGGGNRFVVQKHAATRLHWDFRLEVDGVLKSWAVTRGPSLDPADRRLAVRTEDHPLGYADFEGVIPESEYGGGTVMLWDRGTWEPVPGKSADDLAAGHLHFILHGERMKGEWLLVRMKGRPGEKRENWLLRKVADRWAAAAGDEGSALVDRALASVLTGRTMAEIAADPVAVQPLAGTTGREFAGRMEAAARHNAQVGTRQRRTVPAAPPPFTAVQLATLVDSMPSGNGWMHEIKFDGYRALVAVAGADVHIYTRNGLDWTEKFAPLAAAFAALGAPPALIDGEIVAPGPDGNPSFSALQQLLKRGHGAQRADTPLDFFAFDLLFLDGEDLRPRPAIERKERLEALLGSATPPIHVADHVLGGGEALFAAMCAAGQEGIIAKRIDAPYRAGRNRHWLKVKCGRRQEFVVVGWTQSRRRGRGFASLLLADRAGDVLVYRGKVGTGFDADDFETLGPMLERLEVASPPLDVPRAEARGAHWVRPELVAEIAFSELTGDGHVRHGSFMGLRPDKPAASVEADPPVPPPAASTIRITNRHRVVFPETGQTKGDLADYYAAVAPLMLPFLAGRPVSLVRCPQGRAKKCFFQKHDSGTFGAHVRHVPITEKDGNAEEYLFVDTADGLLACVQMGTIEFHGWGALADAVELPDRMVFDLDPDTGIAFADVARAARDIRAHLATMGLRSFPLLSGGKGVHVVVPLRRGHDWATHADFAARFARALALAEPDRFVATMSKAKRAGRIFIDWLRNQRGSTAILPYSARARPGAPVAVPVGWDELDTFSDAHPFAIGDAGRLVGRAAKLRGWGFATQALPAV